MQTQLRKGLLAVGIFCFVFQSQARSSASEIASDIAIDAVTKESFVLKLKDNPKGQIVITQGQETTEAKLLTISENPVQGARYEIEISTEGHLAYLISNQADWAIGEFAKTSSGDWVKSNRELKGQGFASSLARLPDGNLILSVKPNLFAHTSKVLLVDTTSMKVVDSVDGKKLAKSMAMAQKNLKAESQDNIVGATGNGFGMTAGMISGVGLSYRRFFSDTQGMQVGGIVFADNDSAHFNIGAEFLQTIHQSEKTRFYGLAGASMFYNGDNYAEYDPNTGTELPSEWHWDRFYNFGAGIGLEMYLGNVGISLELPISVSFDYDRTTDGLAFDSIYPIPNLSIIYYLPKKK